MAEEQTPGVQNKKLLIIALVLAAIVVVIYNVHVAAVRRMATGDLVPALKFKRNMDAGQKIKDGDLEEVTISNQFAEGLGSLVKKADFPQIYDKKTLNQKVAKDQWVLWDYVLEGTRGNSITKDITRGMRGIPIELDQNPGIWIVPGDKVTIMGMLSAKLGPLQAYRIITGVQVLRVQGKSILVEVAESESIPLNNVLSRVQRNQGGGVWVEYMNPVDAQEDPGRQDNLGKVNPDLRDLKGAVHGSSGAVAPGGTAL
jgi:hypothetical protein